MQAARYESPFGPLTVLADAQGLRGVHFQTDRFAPKSGPDWVWSDKDLQPVLRALDGYFGGQPLVPDFPLAPAGTPFQQRVWRELLLIPFGRTRTYAEVAAAIGRPGAARAVGGAIGRNPCAVVIPCHRVVGADGSLTGFAAGVGLKARLLAHEAAAR